ncbi:unnamed protein product [Merluccius merluccius]
MSVVVRNRTGWVLDPCAPAERRGGGQDREDQDQEDQNQGDRQNQEVPNQELKGRFRRRCFLASNRPHVVTTDTSSLTPSRKRKRKHVNLNQGEIDAQAYHGQVRAFIVEGTRCLLEAARLLGYLEAGSREDGSRQAGSREAGSREAGSREAVSREAGSREAGSREAGEGEEPPPCPDCNLAALCDMAKQLPLAEEQEEVPVQSLPAGGVCSTSDLDLFSRITENNADSAVEATLLGAHYIIPPHTGFLLSDFTRIQPLVRYGKKFDLIVLDPPWENKSVKRSGRYSILPSSQLKRLPVPLLAAPGCLVVTWVTNKPRLLRFVRDQLYPHWGVRVVAEWLWVKVTTSGEYVFPLDSPHKKPYEVLLLGRLSVSVATACYLQPLGLISQCHSCQIDGANTASPPQALGVGAPAVWRPLQSGGPLQIEAHGGDRLAPTSALRRPLLIHFQSLLVAQQLANAVGGVMSGGAPGLNQPILIPFSTGGHLGGQQGLVMSLPTANIQSLVAAAAAGGIMSLPLQNLQACGVGWGKQRS